MLKDLSKDKA